MSPRSNSITMATKSPMVMQIDIGELAAMAFEIDIADLAAIVIKLNGHCSGNQYWGLRGVEDGK